MQKSATILRIVIASPLRRSFDYLAPLDCDPKKLKKGLRVRVPFGYRETIGILLDFNVPPQVELSKLKRAFEILDSKPLLPEALFELCTFASNYYHHPLGDVLINALPKLLRNGNALPDLSKSETKKNLAEPTSKVTTKKSKLLLNAAQRNAVTNILKKGKTKSKVFLLDGITGSGKTEVYLRVIEKILQEGKQALVLVPEISLTPQTVARFQERFPEKNIAVFHSRLTDKARLQAWQEAQLGLANIVIGTRSALFTPLAKPGIIVIDEEHDLSFKQQSGLRYSARDLAVKRSKLERIPLILGSATPSLASLANVERGAYQHLSLPERVGSAIHPSFHLVDLRKQRLKSGLSLKVIQTMQEHLANNGQILLFINRRGFAPTLLCHYCGWIAQCEKCDLRLTLHQKDKALVCHHCGLSIKAPANCPKCKSPELVPCGIGSERLEIGLKKLFPEVNLVRIDSDTTRKKDALKNMLQEINSGNCKILLGTQMLTKGHHFPDVTMVVILNADQGLFSADFRASEYLAQLIIQVAGRAGRAEKSGQVYIQTHHPEHPLLLDLIQNGYTGFAKASMKERSEADLPPFTHLALWRAESKNRAAAHNFLQALRNYGAKLSLKNVQILGPVPAHIERKAGRFCAQLLIQSKERPALHQLLSTLIAYTENLALAKKVKWTLDVDPMEVL